MSRVDFVIDSRKSLYNYHIQLRFMCATKDALSVNFSSIAIELNVLRDYFSSIAIELTFVILGHGFKKVGSVLFDNGDAWDKEFLKSDYTSLYLRNWMVLRLCIGFTIGGSPRASSKYSH